MNYSAQSQLPPYPPPYTAAQPRVQEDWEDWEDDDRVTTTHAGEQASTDFTPAHRVSSRTSKLYGQRSSRVSAAKVIRVKSRQRQKAQNAKAGIKLITDMSTFRRQTNFGHSRHTPVGRTGKFVDAAALRALEGEPNSASVGNWNWFKRGKDQSPATASPQQLSAQSGRTLDPKLSPDDRPIVIGISLSSEEANGSVGAYNNTSPTPIETPHSQLQHPLASSQLAAPAPAPAPPSKPLPTAAQQKSVWSPDTPDTASSFSTIRYASSIYSQFPVPPDNDAPPVPAVPENFKKDPNNRHVSIDMGGNTQEESDSGTPCTLFEEDGTSSPQKQLKTKSPGVTPDSAGSKTRGWWDHHVVTPFMDKRITFTTALKQTFESPKDSRIEEWWNRVEDKPQPKQTQNPNSNPNLYLTPNLLLGPFQTPIVKEPIPRRTPSPRIESIAESSSGPSTARSSPVPNATSSIVKPRIVITSEVISEQPPPYSPPPKKTEGTPIKYAAVLPPGHALQTQFPPSPGPVSPGPMSPGLASTMSSQRGTRLQEVPLTPAPRENVRDNIRLSQMPLPTRPIGTYVPQEHSLADGEQMTKVERTRRRHEKEEVVARRLGGFWRGRGCIPKEGCFGRTGREGRKRRRVWMIVAGVVIALIVLAITLGVVLSRPHPKKELPSTWVNLTDFPPMPTGGLTVVGPDNVVAKSGCTEPSTMWSCALPKEQHKSVAPYKPTQPTIMMQIQWDNSTHNEWKVPNGDPPSVKHRRSMGIAARASSLIRERQTSDFEPSPDQPDFQEMWFLGNTTDDIKSDEKAGEATPFYISLVDSIETEEKKELVKRDSSQQVKVNLTDALPSPELDEDGKPKPAVLLPKPVQQPVRLYDRGLPTEHYGFYTYFKRTIYLKSVTVLNNTDEGDIPLDEDGGCGETEADFLTTWSETRLLVQIWTRKLSSNTSSLVEPKGMGSIDGSKALIRPGTMPYPVTVTMDTHGGDRGKKFVWAWPINNRQQVDEGNPKLLANNIAYGGTWINKRSDGDEKFGGFDGGTGGCKCQWVNWV
ncbi:hypothetical protein CEP53_007942 [Fusarium sp. AF-6]|nr:hypothetical protein CEP53_007942 [Fusarium sp. AF-6]